MKRFSIVNNGYDIDEVNRFIDIVIARMEKFNAEATANQIKINELEEKLANMNNNEKLEQALLAVQDTGDRIKEMARNEANMILDEAKNNANAIVHEALVNAERIDNKRLILEKNMKIYKGKVRSLLESELALIDEMDKDELSEV